MPEPIPLFQKVPTPQVLNYNSVPPPIAFQSHAIQPNLLGAGFVSVPVRPNYAFVKCSSQ